MSRFVKSTACAENKSSHDCSRIMNPRYAVRHSGSHDPEGLLASQGERIRESAKTRNKNIALKKEAAHRVRLSKGEVEPQTVPTLAEFAPRFESEIETVSADKPATVSFYKEKSRRLLDDSTLPGTRLDAIGWSPKKPLAMGTKRHSYLLTSGCCRT